MGEWRLLPVKVLVPAEEQRRDPGRSISMRWVPITASLTKGILGRPLPADPCCPLRHSGVLCLDLHPGFRCKTTLSMAFTFFLFALRSPIDGHGLPCQRKGFRNSKRLMDLVLITQQVRG